MEVSTTLVRPDGLADEVWRAIEDHQSRFNLALATADRSLAIGSAKELVEELAKIVLDTRGVPYGAGDVYEQVVSAAHAAFERCRHLNVPMDATTV